MSRVSAPLRTFSVSSADNETRSAAHAFLRLERPRVLQKVSNRAGTAEERRKQTRPRRFFPKLLRGGLAPDGYDLLLRGEWYRVNHNFCPSPSANHNFCRIPIFQDLGLTISACPEHRTEPYVALRPSPALAGVQPNTRQTSMATPARNATAKRTANIPAPMTAARRKTLSNFPCETIPNTISLGLTPTGETPFCGASAKVPRRIEGRPRVPKTPASC